MSKSLATERLYIFDWDGTLCNSLDAIVSSIRHACTAMQLPLLTDFRYQSVIGLGLTEAMLDLYPELSEQRLQQILDAYKEQFVKGNTHKPPKLYEGVIEVLTALKAQGHQLAVATGKSRRGLDRNLEALLLQDFFDFSRCADETKSKPDPLMVNEILQEANVEPERALMVGDTDFDINMGNSAQVVSIAVDYGAHDLERIMAANPDRVIGCLSELLD